MTKVKTTLQQLHKQTPKRGHAASFAILMVMAGGLLFLSAIMFLFLGAEHISPVEVLQALIAYDADIFNHVIVCDLRLPRLLADIMVGSALAVAGAVMQGNTKNPMADSGLMGISAGSSAAIVLMVHLLPSASRLERMAFSSLGAATAIALIYAVAWMGRKRPSAERLVLAGMAISTLFSSFAMAVVLKFNLSHVLLKYTAGSSANTVWADIKIAAPFFTVSMIAVICLARSLTVMNLGEEVSKGLGANVRLISALSTLIVLVLSAVAVIIIGPVGYVGLMVPHIVRYVVGADYRYIVPACMVVGAALVAIVDLFAKLMIAPREFPIGVMMTLIGVPFFLYIAQRQKHEQFN